MRWWNITVDQCIPEKQKIPFSVDNKNHHYVLIQTFIAVKNIDRICLMEVLNFGKLYLLRIQEKPLDIWFLSKTASFSKISNLAVLYV